jgi:hypothetical protein
VKLIARTEYPGNVTRLVRWRGWRVALSRTELPWEFAAQVGGPDYVFALYWGCWSLRVMHFSRIPASGGDVFVPEPAADGL